jgi:hypothetical protein
MFQKAYSASRLVSQARGRGDKTECAARYLPQAILSRETAENSLIAY